MARILAFASLAAGAMATFHEYMPPPVVESVHEMKGSCGYGGCHSGSSKINVEVGVTIISSCAGGGAPMEHIAPPPYDMTGMNHTVIVGGEDLVYSPEYIMAEAGDMVEFVFMKQNHTFTQSTFGTPCIKMEGGVDSGFMPNPNNTMNPPPSMWFQVTTKEPIWMYCRQKTHCGKGMVFSINATPEKSHEKFKEMAIQQNGTEMDMGMETMTMEMETQTSTYAPPAETYTPPPPETYAPPPPAATGIVSGSGYGSGDACSCSCLCGVESFPVGDGVGMWGGMSGSMPGSYMK